MKDLQISLGDTNVTHNRHEDELTLIFNKLSMFQEGVLYKNRTVTERVNNMEAPTQTGFVYQGSSQLYALVKQISKLEKDRISDSLCIDGLESTLNAGTDELAIG